MNKRKYIKTLKIMVVRTCLTEFGQFVRNIITEHVQLVQLNDTEQKPYVQS